MRRALPLVLMAGLVGLTGLVVTGCGGEDEQREQSNTDAKVVYINTRCPIMPQNEIKPDEVPEEMVTEFRGHKVAFCCGGCPSQWEQLSDEEKVAKLMAVGVDRDELE